MEEMVICRTGYGEGISDEGYLDRLIDEAFAMVERVDNLWRKITAQIDERLLARQSTELV